MRTALEAFAAMPIRVNGVVAGRTRHDGVHVQDLCLPQIVRDLQARSVPRLTIESRQDDNDDRRTIARQRTRQPSVVFEHREALRGAAALDRRWTQVGRSEWVVCRRNYACMM